MHINVLRNYVIGSETKNLSDHYMEFKGMFHYDQYDNNNCEKASKRKIKTKTAELLNADS